MGAESSAEVGVPGIRGAAVVDHRHDPCAGQVVGGGPDRLDVGVRTVGVVVRDQGGERRLDPEHLVHRGQGRHRGHRKAYQQTVHGGDPRADLDRKPGHEQVPEAVEIDVAMCEHVDGDDRIPHLVELLEQADRITHLSRLEFREGPAVDGPFGHDPGRQVGMKLRAVGELPDPCDAIRDRRTILSILVHSGDPRPGAEAGEEHDPVLFEPLPPDLVEIRVQSQQHVIPADEVLEHAIGIVHAERRHLDASGPKLDRIPIRPENGGGECQTRPEEKGPVEGALKDVHVDTSVLRFVVGGFEDGTIDGDHESFELDSSMEDRTDHRKHPARNDLWTSKWPIWPARWWRPEHPEAVRGSQG